MNLVRKRLLGGVAVIALVAGACSSSSATASPSAGSSSSVVASPTAHAPVTIEWWHISINDPGKTIWYTAAQQYMASHPWVTINITVLENEAFKTKLQTTLQSGKAPDLFQSWGGGTMAAQANAGMLKDISADIANWSDPAAKDITGLSVYQYKGKTYGLPWDMGMIGFFYNRKLFAQAGITTPPTTWTEYLADIDKLKAANIVPYAIAGADKWPGMHLWSYLVLREGGSAAFSEMIESGDWNKDACTKGGTDLQALVAKNPFQPGYLAAKYDKGEAAAMGNGQAAMELMGQWGPSVQVANSTSGKGIGTDLGWFAFPGVEGGKGATTDGIGGGNGIVVGKDAPAEAIDFLHFLASNQIMSEVGETGMGLPTTAASLQSVSDPILKDVLTARNKATFMQNYLDQFVSPGLGAAINDATAELIAGKSTPAQVCQAITDAAKNE